MENETTIKDSIPATLTETTNERPTVSRLCLVPVTGLEPVRCRQRWILSPLRLPFHHTGRCTGIVYYILFKIARKKFTFFIFLKYFTFCPSWFIMADNQISHRRCTFLNKKLYWALIIVFSVVFLISAVFVVDYIIDSYQNKQMNNGLQVSTPPPHTGPLRQPTTGTIPGTTITIPTPPSTTVPTPPPTTVPTQPTTQAPSDPTTASGMLPDLETLYNLNNDVVGYIYIPDTNIIYPVLHHPGEKDYYLYRDFYGREDRHGSIYVREACDVFGPSDNVTIYGHNMADSSMFANVHKFKDETFFDNHPLIYFDTLYERHVYQVVCIFRTSGTYGVGFPFHLYDNFKDEAEFNQFIKGIRKKNDKVDLINDSGIAVEYGDKFICLSTCEDWPIKNGRLVLLAVRIA